MTGSREQAGEANDGLKEQRELALACAVLAGAISVSVLLSNFRNLDKDLEPTRASIAEHQRLLTESEAALQQNVKELDNVRAALEQAKAVRNK